MADYYGGGTPTIIDDVSGDVVTWSGTGAIPVSTYTAAEWIYDIFPVGGPTHLLVDADGAFKQASDDLPSSGLYTGTYVVDTAQLAALNTQIATGAVSVQVQMSAPYTTQLNQLGLRLSTAPVAVYGGVGGVTRISAFYGDPSVSNLAVSVSSGGGATLGPITGSGGFTKAAKMAVSSSPRARI